MLAILMIYDFNLIMNSFIFAIDYELRLQSGVNFDKIKITFYKIFMFVWSVEIAFMKLYDIFSIYELLKDISLRSLR